MANEQRRGLTISCSICGRSLDNIEYTKFGEIRFCGQCGKPIPEKKNSSSEYTKIRRNDQDIWEENLKALFDLHIDYDNHIYVAIDKRTGHPYVVCLQNIQYGGFMAERMELVQIDYCGVSSLSKQVSLYTEIEGINYTNWQRYAEKMQIIDETEGLRKRRAFIEKCMLDRTPCEKEMDKKLLLQQQLREQYDKLFTLNFVQKRKLAQQIREIDRSVALLKLKIPEERNCREKEYAKKLSLCDTEIQKKEQDLKNLSI